MEYWQQVSGFERRQFQAISTLTSQNPQLLTFLFDPKASQLRLPVDRLLKEARGLSSGEYLLVKIAIDLWCEQGQVQIHQLLNLDPVNFKLALTALAELYPS